MRTTRQDEQNDPDEYMYKNHPGWTVWEREREYNDDFKKSTYLNTKTYAYPVPIKCKINTKIY